MSGKERRGRQATARVRASAAARRGSGSAGPRRASCRHRTAGAPRPRAPRRAEAQRQDAVLQSDDEHDAEFEPLRGVQGQQRDAVAALRRAAPRRSQSGLPGSSASCPFLRNGMPERASASISARRLRIGAVQHGEVRERQVGAAASGAAASRSRRSCARRSALRWSAPRTRLRLRSVGAAWIVMRSCIARTIASIGSRAPSICADAATIVPLER